jgi:predicted GIY-YIG superfamily endonuclease
VGTTRAGLEKRVAEHQQGAEGYTSCRRPIELVFSQEFQRVEDAIAAERQVKGWRREKKEALIRGDLPLLRILARRGTRSATA